MLAESISRPLLAIWQKLIQYRVLVKVKISIFIMEHLHVGCYIVIILMLNHFLISTSYLAVSDDDLINQTMHNFYMRKFENDRIVLIDHILNCNDVKELHRIQGIIDKSLAPSLTQVHPVEESSTVVTEVPDRTSSSMKALLFFVGMSLAIIAIWYSKDILEILFSTIFTLRSNILVSLDELFIKDPEAMERLIIALELIDKT
jgi:hypothetical protein